MIKRASIGRNQGRIPTTPFRGPPSKDNVLDANVPSTFEDCYQVLMINAPPPKELFSSFQEGIAEEASDGEEEQ